AAKQHGVEDSRLVFASYLALSSEHLARHRLADLFLDTLPYNAHTTSNDALWAGLPIVTCAGETFASRVVASLLSALDLPELITETLEDYESLALHLANHAEQLKAIREKLANHRLTQPLFNTALFTRHIEAAYETMVQRVQQGLEPESFDVSATVETAPVKVSVSSDKFQQALSLHQQGQTQAAQALYEEILQAEPQHIDTLHFLGVLYYQTGNPEKAIELIKQSLNISPDNTAAYNNCAMVLNSLNRFDEAAECYANVVALKPHDSAALLQYGNLLLALNRAEQAAISYETYLNHHDDSAVLLSYGIALQLLRRFDDALECYQRILNIEPNHAEALFGLANALYRLNRLEDALEAYTRSLTLNADSADAWFNQAVILEVLKRVDDAMDCYKKALAVKPDYAQAYNNIGTLFSKQQDHTAAIASYKQAIAVCPSYAEAYCNLVNLQKDLGQLNDAETTLNNALQVMPDNVDLRFIKLNLTLPLMPKTAEESASVPVRFDNALTELEDWAATHSSLLHNAQLLPLPFMIAYRVGNHTQRLSRFGDLISVPTKTPIKTTKEKLKLAVISHHFRRHSVWDVITHGFLINLDRSRFDLVLYHIGDLEDAETELAKSLATVWRDTHTVMDLTGWFHALETDAPDIIFYPEIGMDPTSARLAARRIAPLQVASWGHPMTTGLATIDLYFSGELLESADADSHYRERLIRLPNTGCCTTPIPAQPEPLDADVLNLLNQHAGTRFIIAQTAYKFEPADDAVYVAMAQQTDGVFILLSSGKDDWAMKNISERLKLAFKEQGLNSERVLLLPRLSTEKFYTLLDLCDVYLDCPSFSGYTTAWQTIHRGLPIVTLEGEFMRQRLAAGLLRFCGITDTIASTRIEYVEIAVKLAQENRTVAQARRETLKAAAPKVDHDLTAVKAFEQVLLTAWQQR
ncbi:partial protein O-GlcNAc transferase, partial [Patescibacteria group bacterium]